MWPVRLWVGSGSRHLQVEIHGSGHRICVSNQRKNARQVGVLSVKMRLERAGVGELPVDELHVEIEFERVGIAAQSAVAHRENRRRELNIRLQSIPVDRFFGSVRGGRNQRLEILRLQIARDGDLGKLSGGGAVERGVAFQRDRNLAWHIPLR